MRLMSIGMGSLLIATACGRPVGSDEKSVAEFSSESLMRPGVGVLSAFGEVRGDCVDYDSVKPVTANLGVENIYKLELIESSSHLTRSLNVSTAAQIGAIGPIDQHISEKTKISFDAKVDRYSIYLMVSSQVRNQTHHLQNPRLKPELIKLASTDFNAFRQRCGDSYLAGVTSGAEYYGLIEIRVANDSEKNSVMQELEGSGIYGAVKVSGSATADASNSVLSKLKSRKVWQHQKGGIGANVTAPRNVEEMIEHARKLPEFVSEAGSAWPISATFNDYIALLPHLPNGYTDQLESIMSVTAKLGDLRGQMLDSIASLGYALTNRSEFPNADFAQIKRTKESVASSLEQLTELVRKCYKDFASAGALCVIPDALAKFKISLPSRELAMARCSENRQWKIGDICLKQRSICVQLVEKSDTREEWRRVECSI